VEEHRDRVNNGALDRVFAPRSVAIAGGTRREPAQLVLETLLAAGFRGRIHLVNSDAVGASGRKVYRSVAEIPGPVDYVACCVPALQVLPLLGECAAKQAGTVAILTDGLTRNSSEQATRLKREVSALAKETGLRVLGPNCLGVYCPRGGMSFDTLLPAEGGRMGFIGQGRESSLHILRAAGQRGVRFSKAISYGNAWDIGESELLEYFAQDGDTDAVAACIEEVRDGKRFLRALRDLSEAKPVILLKSTPTSGRSKGMNIAKTGDANQDQIWNAVLEQTGTIGIRRAEDLVDAMVAFSMLQRPRGRRLGIFGGAGGASVLATDVWANAGFVLPPVPASLRATFDDAALNKAGMMLHNPLDFSMSSFTDFFYGVVKRMIADEEFVDLSVIHNPTGQGAWMPWSYFCSMIDSMAKAAIEIHREIPKPMVLVMHYTHSRQHWQKILEGLQAPCAQAGVPVYYSMASAARAIDRMLRYYDRRSASAETT
jgi:acyl-CoA synthetase (NDP forming)